MSQPGHVLAIDQGTTSSRAMVFDSGGTPVAQVNREFTQHYPRPAWVEHEPEVIWQDTVWTCQEAMREAGIDASGVAAIGITNQRETTVIWDAETGAPIHNAIVWQDRRTSGFCDRLKEEGHAGLVQERTGLVIDAYFSGSKVAWLLNNVDGARSRADAGKLRFGTIDCYLLWKLTGGRVHATDTSNAARTMLFNIHTQDWDYDLLTLLNIPRSLMPEVRDNACEFGTTEPSLFGSAIAVRGMAGDQQAATFGQCCFEPGMIKSTYGTGCFALINTGDTAVTSKNQLLTTVAYRLGGKVTYAIEGSIFIAGAAVQWLRDELKLIRTAPETEDLARNADPQSRVYLVPAFTGLGAPYWDQDARGAIFGLTRGTGPAEIARATLESVCFQTRDLFEAMAADGAEKPAALRVDGGMVANDWAMQFLADILGVTVERPMITETTALGAAYLGGMQAGLYPDMEGLSRQWEVEATFRPVMAENTREPLYDGWRDAVRRTRSAS